MNKRNKAILDWVRKNRPGLVKHFETIIADEGILLHCATVGFEAGRQFQRDNPKSRSGNHKMYA